MKDTRKNNLNTQKPAAAPTVQSNGGSALPPPVFAVKSESTEPDSQDQSSFMERNAIAAPPISPPTDNGTSSFQINTTAPPVQRKESGAVNAFTPPSNASNNSLPNAVRGKMESAFKTDFSDVSIHQNSSEATGLGAQAFARGNDIHFAPGKFNPSSPQGQELIGHELTHIIQQRAGKVKPTIQAKGVTINDDVSLEKEADDRGRLAAQGKDASFANASSNNTSAPVVQGLFGWAKDKLKSAGSWVGDKATDAWDGVKSGAAKVGHKVKKGWQGAKVLGQGANLLGKLALDGAKHGAESLGKAAWNSAKRLGNGVVDGAKNVGNGLWDGAKSVGAGLSSSAKSIGNGVLNGAKSVGRGLSDGAKSVGSGLLGGVENIAKGNYWEGAKSIGGGLWGGAKSAGSGLWNGAKSVGTGLSNSAKNLAGGLWNGAKSVGSGLANGAKSVGSAVAGEGKRLFNTGKNAWNGIQDFNELRKKDGFGSALEQTVLNKIYEADRANGPQGQAANLNDLTEEYAFDEFMTDAAYYGKNEDRKELSDTDGMDNRWASERDRLAEQGYDPDTFQTVEGANGLQMIYALPAEGSDVEPYLSMRGSEADEDLANDWGSDFDYNEVGETQYQNNEETINQLVQYLSDSSSTGRIQISGHSLGGGLAQQVTANNPKLISRLTAFQNPGVSQETYDTYMQNIADLPEGVAPPEIAYHYAENDIVHLAGEKNLPGTHYVHESGGWVNNAQVSRTSGATAIPHTETLVDDRNDQILQSGHGVTKYNQYPFPEGRNFAEGMRKEYGTNLQGILNAFDEYKYQ